MTQSAKTRAVGKWSLFTIALILSLILMLPFFYMVFCSLQPDNLTVISGEFFPKAFQLRNYLDAVKEIKMFDLLKNTLVVVVGNLTLVTISTLIIAYGFARFDGVGKNVLFYIVMSTMMLPWVVTLVPSYVIFDRLGWVNTFLPLIIPAIGGSAFYIFMMRQFFMNIPRDLDEAATIGGCNSFMILFRILLPQMKPAIATMLILSFNGVWSDYIGPNLYLQKPALHTLSIGLNYFKSMSGGSMPWHIVMAACTLFSLPMALVMFFAQDAFTRGIVTSGLK